jgi:hypothetical protein
MEPGLAPHPDEKVISYEKSSRCNPSTLRPKWSSITELFKFIYDSEVEVSNSIENIMRMFLINRLVIEFGCLICSGLAFSQVVRMLSNRYNFLKLV